MAPGPLHKPVIDAGTLAIVNFTQNKSVSAAAGLAKQESKCRHC